MNWLEALFLGLVEGLTEFLPISSTAHLMLVEEWLKLPKSDFLTSFTIAIQPGAILAVVVLYWRSLFVKKAVALRVLVAFVPTAVLGLLVYKLVTRYLLKSPELALGSLAIGGVVLILFEWLHGERPESEGDLAGIPLWKAFAIGSWQALAFVPGVSRAAATVCGALVHRIRRPAAVEFSFLLAVPTMLAATAKDLWEHGAAFSSSQFEVLAIGFATSFVVALIAIKWLVRYVQTHTFLAFGVYRILIAGVFWWLLYARG